MKTYRNLACALLLALPTVTAPATTVFINELHYDNAGGDVGEGVEIVASSGLDLSGFTLALYNGSNGSVYRDVALAGTVADEGSGFGALFFDINSMQNGAPDGLALVDAGGTVIQFLSYEGAFVASEGAALGMTSSDIGVLEDGSNAAGTSLQLGGFGSAYEDFGWISANSSYGSVNAGQVFAPVPVPPALPLLAAAFATLGALRQRRIG